MSDKTGIEWTDATWNPIVGCSLVSPGCTNCYAMKMAARIQAMCGTSGPLPHEGAPHYSRTTRVVNGKAVWTGHVAVAPDRILTAPLRWKRPRRIFVNSMGDLFHESVPDEWIDRVFAVMALAPQHTFQVLTKRSARMRDYLSNGARPFVIAEAALTVGRNLPDSHPGWLLKNWKPSPIKGCTRPARWPLPNVWLGVSAEDQRRADERIPDLLATPAAVRFVSAEPLLGPIDFTNHDPSGEFAKMKAHGWSSIWRNNHIGRAWLDWIIVGGESGPSARPMHPDWARAIRDQCAAADVAYYFKQWGEWETALDRERDDPDWRANYSFDYVNEGKSKWLNLAGGSGFHGERFHVMRRVGKAMAGRLLDGVEHNAFPEPRA